MSTGRRVAAAGVAVVLAVLAGTGLWIQLVYDESPGSHRITVVAPRGNDGEVAFVLDRYPDVAAPASEIVTTGPWEERPPGTMRLESGHGRASYRGVVDDRVAVRFRAGPDGGRARVDVDGSRGRIVSLRSTEGEARVVNLHFDERVPTASWFLLALMLAVSVAAAGATVWCVVRLAAVRGSRTAIVVGSVGLVAAALVAVVPFSVPSVVDAAGGTLSALDHLGLGVAAGLLVSLVASLALGVRPRAAPAWVTEPEDARDRWRLTLLLAVVPFVGLLALVLLFWPGLMNPDSVVQWFQVERTGLDDWHPYAVTLVYGGLRALVDSPAVPIVLQAVGASVLIGRIAAWTIWRGRTPWVAAATLVLVPLLPSTGLHTITLWKDTPFGLALLGLALIVWRVVDTRGQWLSLPRNLVLTGVAMVGLSLSRHNGWPIVVATAIVLVLVQRAAWRRLVAVTGVALAITLMVQIPIGRLLDVRESRVPSIVYVQHIANQVNEGTELTRSDRALLRTIFPLDREWPYSCHSIQTTWSGPQAIPLPRFTGKSGELRSLAIDLALRNPGAELGHLACASELVWKPGDDDGVTYFLEWSSSAGHVDYIPRFYDDTPTENPGSPRAINRIYDVVTDVLPIWLLRPALYLYAFLLAIAFAARRRRSWAVAWIAVPAVVQSLILAALTLVQDVRFQYGVTLTAVVLVPALLTVAPRSSAEDGLPLRWRRRSSSLDA